MLGEKNILYIFDSNLIEECNRLPAVIGRATLVHNLIAAYNLLDKLKVVRSSPASYEDLKSFHSETYLDHLKTFNEIDDEYTSNAQDEKFGLGYDCPPVSHMFELVTTIAGGSLTAAKTLVQGAADVAINWCGGWHHGQRGGAEGFCYVNDIVIAIETLRQKFPKVLYIDLDVHHGNGVQNAYNLSKSVFTLSFHKYEPGFYPGTGGVDDIGTSDGKGYACNVPLLAAYTDDTLEYVFESIFSSVYSLFAPDAVVVQCGGDALAHDRSGGAALTSGGYGRCVGTVLGTNKPVLLLGGGGYHHANTARLWASLTALALGTTLPEEIPEHANWPSYGPLYTMSVEVSLARNCNKKGYLDHCIATIKSNLQEYLVDNDRKKIAKYTGFKRKNEKGSGDGTKDNVVEEKCDPNSVYDFNED